MSESKEKAIPAEPAFREFKRLYIGKEDEKVTEPFTLECHKEGEFYKFKQVPYKGHTLYMPDIRTSKSPALTEVEFNLLFGDWDTDWVVFSESTEMIGVFCKESNTFHKDITIVNGKEYPVTHQVVLVPKITYLVTLPDRVVSFDTAMFNKCFEAKKEND